MQLLWCTSLGTRCSWCSGARRSRSGTAGAAGSGCVRGSSTRLSAPATSKTMFCQNDLIFCIKPCLHWMILFSFQWLRIRIQDPVPFWHRDPGWVKNQDPDPGSEFRMNNPDHNSESLKNYFLGWNSLMWIRDGKSSDPGWEKVGSGIRDKLPDL